MEVVEKQIIEKQIVLDKEDQKVLLDVFENVDWRRLGTKQTCFVNGLILAINSSDDYAKNN
jgi:hypothetical protein